MNRKGSAIVEAAMVFPVILLSLMAVLYMLIYFYDQVGDQVDLHIALRSESGSICNNMYYGNHNEKNLPVYRNGQKIHSYSTVSSGKNVILQKRNKAIYAEKHLIDETEIVRMADFAKIRSYKNLSGLSGNGGTAGHGSGYMKYDMENVMH